MPTFIRLPSGRYVNLDQVTRAVPCTEDGNPEIILWFVADNDNLRLARTDRAAVLAALDALAWPVRTGAALNAARAEAVALRQLLADAAARLREMAGSDCRPVCQPSDLLALAAVLDPDPPAAG